MANSGKSWPARAKINLFLHVTGRRPDGYHSLESLVVFADLADLIEIESSDELSLTIRGPFAAGLPAELSHWYPATYVLFEEQASCQLVD